MEDAEFYYLHYKTWSVDQLVEKIDTQSLRDSISSCVDSGCDILLIHAIYRLSSDTKMYRKREIRDYLWSKLAPRCSVSFGCSLEEYRNGYVKLFYYCWRQWFIAEGHVGKRLSKIVYSRRSFWMKMVSNNFVLLLFLVAFVWLQYWINDCLWLLNKYEYGWPLFLGILALWFSSLLKSYAWFPLIFFIGYIVLALANMFDPMSAYIALHRVDIAKGFVYKAFSCLLWYPMVLLNSERIEDLYG